MGIQVMGVVEALASSEELAVEERFIDVEVGKWPRYGVCSMSQT